ncbi:MAG TPA: DnaJ domain-containing protein [Thiobacillus sp.]|nr:MAG: molecular chaperone DnaJ [Hydrogenophilales bacterium 28-61-11]OYZ56042.1 MAG: molecular chaperone DnaJ [Hydrogenophilales bacterium 16-61-112]OZA41215.1 MAG: molecular chaperone DnaJ [Hydrogenophilales bacterium 17-61-76]HQT31660.1 DnaJ domain-containing protein [Thiobacillus sp.]HQT71236.1 DnaJ domain-containing protein [Thiobacillus sp.]
MQDHYEKLGVPPSATHETIKLAYRKKAAFYHPDKNSADDAALRFREVQDAYEVLSDPERKQSYDEYRQRSLIDDPVAVAQDMAAKYIQGILN